jgi:large subunit ribosomal protein L17
MVHKRKLRSFSRHTKQTKALLRALVTSFFTYGFLKTTETKAKAVRPIVEKIITKAKEKNVNNIRSLKAYLYTEESIEKAFDLGQKFQKRPGGYLKITKGTSRLGDGANIAVLEQVPQDI